MQPENEKKFTDGRRLEALKSATGKTWDAIIEDLGVSRSMLFSVLKGSKRLGRDNLSRLCEIEAAQSSAGKRHDAPVVYSAREGPSAYGTPEMLRAENEALRAELRQALDSISNLSKALARSDESGSAGRGEHSAKNNEDQKGG